MVHALGLSTGAVGKDLPDTTIQINKHAEIIGLRLFLEAVEMGREAGSGSLLVWAHLLLPGLDLLPITCKRAIPRDAHEAQPTLLAGRSIFLAASPCPFNSLLGMGCHEILRLLQILVMLLLVVERHGVVCAPNA